ncbi:MAG: hypothetical protein MR853_04715, partial [Selenomonadales bacterium]|nr:hypothetical protein [Selenomonadales bacterium]
PEVVGKTASAAVNYSVSKGCCPSKASSAFAGIIPLERRQFSRSEEKMCLTHDTYATGASSLRS